MKQCVEIDGEEEGYEESTLAALPPIVQEAGSVVTVWTGAENRSLTDN